MVQINVSEKIKTHTLYSTTFFNNLAFYEIMWKNIVQSDRLQITMWCMRIACWMSKSVDTHSEYVIFFAFPLQQFMHQRPSVLLCVHCLSCTFSRLFISEAIDRHKYFDIAVAYLSRWMS
jgi:hypothetical protein